jgi:hypothetical protein
VITDISLSTITENKFVIYPYISTQKEFGYSDVTSANTQDGYVDSIFEASMSRFEKMNKVRKYYFG